jgi:hypothetical protein
MRPSTDSSRTSHDVAEVLQPTSHLPNALLRRSPPSIAALPSHPRDSTGAVYSLLRADYPRPHYCSYQSMLPNVQAQPCSRQWYPQRHAFSSHFQNISGSQSVIEGLIHQSDLYAIGFSQRLRFDRIARPLPGERYTSCRVLASIFVNREAAASRLELGQRLYRVGRGTAH